MSTNWIPRRSIPFAALETFSLNGIEARAAEDGRGLVLTDGENCLSVYPVEEENTVLLARSGRNDPVAILSALEDAFGVKLVSEYDPEYGELSERVLKE